MMERYELSPEAIEDLLKIQDFISLDSPAAAERVIDQLFMAFEHLATWPRSGHSRKDLTLKSVLFWSIDSYLIVYHLRDADSFVQIVAVLHAARDIPSVLEGR